MNYRRVQASLCARCKHLSGVEITTAAWRTCTAKGTGHFEDECDKFASAPTPDRGAGKGATL